MNFYFRDERWEDVLSNLIQIIYLFPGKISEHLTFTLAINTVKKSTLLFTMEPLQLLKNNLSERITITDAEMELVAKYFRAKSIKKKKDFNRLGDVCKDLAFICKGAMRCYSIDDKGIEHISRFAFENYWLADLHSYFNNIPSDYTIETMEDTELLVISNYDLDRIYLEVPIMERFFRKLFVSAYTFTLERLNNNVSQSVEARYKKLLQSHPHLFQRVPLVYIASYLGTTPETISRIRKSR